MGQELGEPPCLPGSRRRLVRLRPLSEAMRVCYTQETDPRFFSSSVALSFLFLSPIMIFFCLGAACSDSYGAEIS